MAGLVAIRAAAADVELGPELQLNEATGRSESEPGIASRGADGFVVVWTSSQDPPFVSEVHARLLDADGAPQGGELDVSDGSDLLGRDPAVAAAREGDFVVAWQSSHRELRARRFAVDGTPLTADSLIVPYVTGQTPLERPHVGAFDDGGFVVTWRGSGRAIQARLFDSAGEPAGSAFVVTEDGYREARVAIDPSGSFVIAWANDGYRNPSGYSVRLRRFDRDGEELATELAVTESTSDARTWPDVAALGSGRFVVVWGSYELFGPDAYGYGVRARVVGAPGAPSTPPFQVNSYTTGYQAHPNVAADADGRFVVSWPEAERPPLTYFPVPSLVRARAFEVDGSPIGDDLQVDRYAMGSFTRTAVAGARDGTFAVVWRSESPFAPDATSTALHGAALTVPAPLPAHDFEGGDLGGWDEVVP